MAVRADEHIRAECFHPSGKFVEFPKEDIETSIPKRFEKIVRLYPGRLAVKTKNHALTYDQLNRAANRVARAVLEKRGDDNEPVAILVGHDVAAIVAILGVLKAGKIYVPLDPSFPPTRIESMLSDSQANILVTNQENLGLTALLTKDALEALNIDDLEQKFSDDNPGQTITPDTLASIYYTSGSTGEPKGVFQNHRNILYNVMMYTNDIHIGLEDRLTLLHSCAFNASVRNFLGSLLNGAAVYPFDAREKSLTALADWLIEEGITIYHSAATLFRALTEALTGQEHFHELRLIQLSNESVTPEDVRKFKTFFASHCIFANRLGISGIGTLTRLFIGKDDFCGDVSVPAGYPVEGMEVLLLDENLREVGFDCVGEIAVKSRYLALGYWRRPDLTKSKFLPDPKGGDERIYLTGDLGRMTSDGCLYHLGRKDFTVKVRGYRVVLSEIEAALQKNSGIKEVAVTAGENPSGDQRLVAYIVPRRKPRPTSRELREFLRPFIPEPMIPSIFVTLDSLPLTPTGKVDRAGLPAPTNARPDVNTPYLAPRTPVERELAKFWSEVLSLDQVGVYDNFFDLGGHSLAATRVIARVFQHFQLEIPLNALFQSPTVAEMAAVITEHQGNKLSEKELEQILTEIESLSEDEAQKRLSESSPPVVKN